MDAKKVDVVVELDYLRQYIDFGLRYLTKESWLSPSECQKVLNRWDALSAEVKRLGAPA